MSRLNGLLDVTVEKASGLPNLDRNEKKPDDLSDPYVAVYVIGKDKDKSKLSKTSTVKDSVNPNWNYSVSAQIDHNVSEILFIVYDKDSVKSEEIGSAAVSGSSFEKTDGWNGDLKLTNKKQESAGTLTVSVKFSGSISPCTAKTDKRKQVITVNKSSKKAADKSGHEPEELLSRGQLHINIIKAENLPNLDHSTFNKKNKSDPLVIASLVDKHGAEHEVATTACIKDNLNPMWNEDFSVNVSHEISGLSFKVFDKDLHGKDLIGSLNLPIAQLKKEKSIEGKFPLKRKDKNSGTLQVSVKLE